MGKTILAIGGHIGDMELTAGGVMATNALNGGKNITLALTAGERGNPKHLTVEEYRKQKIEEATRFMKMMNGEAIVLEYRDGELPNDEKVRREVAEIIAKHKPDIIITHWHSRMHKDHNATHYIVQDAQFIASVVAQKKEDIMHPFTLLKTGKMIMISIHIFMWISQKVLTFGVKHYTNTGL